MTGAEALRQGTEALQRAGVAAPKTDARRILAHVLGAEDTGVTAMRDDAVPEPQAALFRQMIADRERRVPVAQIVGYRDFWRHRFRITADVLDPRPETELLVELALQEPFRKVLDLGVGSGCILISLLAERPQAQGVGTDISDQAVLIAGENAVRAGVADRIVLPLSDWWQDVGGRYDLIVSNPPYIAADEMADLAPELSFEPRAALTDDRDGLSAHRAIARGLAGHLIPGGRVLLEIGPSQADAIRDLLVDAGLADVVVHRDLGGRDRVIAARMPA